MMSVLEESDYLSVASASFTSNRRIALSMDETQILKFQYKFKGMKEKTAMKKWSYHVSSPSLVSLCNRNTSYNTSATINDIQNEMIWKRNSE